MAKDKAAKEAAAAPQKALPGILGLALKKAYGVLTQFLKLAPSGKSKTTPMAWGGSGKISIKSQFYICTAKPSTRCRLKGLMLFSNAYTGSIVGGMTVSYTNTKRAKTIATAITLFATITGAAKVGQVQRWLRTQFLGRKPALKKFGKHELFISQSPNGKQWNIAVSLK
ncbi:MAG TPA: hypothetical protein EYN06_02285 [Myxococcales bacterium]|nr:hypothetical protein [Myxococcales bacterium]